MPEATTATPSSADRMKDLQAYPTLLTSADAMLWAADHLDKKIVDLDLIEVMRKTILQPETVRKLEAEAPDGASRVRELRRYASGVVDADIQRAAMKSAVATIRAAANEEKLANARAALRGARP